MRPDASIFVAGHRGMVGSALFDACAAAGFESLVLRDRSELDLTRQADVERFFAQTRRRTCSSRRPKWAILANDSNPAEFLRDNLAIQTKRHRRRPPKRNVQTVVPGLQLRLSRLAPQPIAEESLLTGPLERTNEWYAIAKICGHQDVRGLSAPVRLQRDLGDATNLYGPQDNFDLASSHVLPALLRKFHEAVQRGADSVEVWGTGTPRREFLHVDDLAEACVFLMRRYDDAGWINIGWGRDLTIAELAQAIGRVVASRARSGSTRPSRTALPANCWILRA